MRALLPAAIALFAAGLAAAQTSWSLVSPNGSCEICVMLDGGELSYRVNHAGRPVLLKSPLGLCREEARLDQGLVVRQVGRVEKRRESYELLAGVAPRVDHVLNHRSLEFRNANNVAVILDLAAANEGVAFRYRFPRADATPDVRILSAELTGFALPADAQGWLQPYHAAGPYTPAYEDFYFKVKPGELPPESRAKPVGWGFPALFHVPGADAWVLLTESGNDGGFCGCHLRPDSSNGVYRIAFPLEDEATRRHRNQCGPQPRSILPWTMPWRVLALGRTAGEIAVSTLVTDLAPPSRVADTSWIRPGRASWAWWSYPEGPATAARFNEFADFGARMGWEYTLFDAGWWSPGLSSIVPHALAAGVAPLAWHFASDFYDPVQRHSKLDAMVIAGVRGVKVDFWCSDRQEAIAAMQSLFEDAAARHLVVNLHGCTVPRGWTRTWPNFLTAEAVLGEESYMFEPRYTDKAAELNTVLPFTRNAIGPMDATPVGCSPKKYPRTTTAAHELATAIIFTSGIIHYADKPEFFESLPAEVVQVLRDAPARWDETRCLVGEPGRVVVFARRSGKSWFVAGLNGTGEVLPVELDLAPFKRFRRRLLISEGAEPRMHVTAHAIPSTKRWSHRIPARGGFILRLEQ